ncbi:hypothetical protein G647_09733 [Cladophialophora carrionii CBS 160.54]|uniref:LysM domain-containing protein n=1 Tax=Cladophialophora carrionii CBS 160.54 TaxID=1279043 RepID=V9DNK3_9EURO|nr:uncharacterized protein G647_09733 [Cladophialophora carrionii CBS 160.54]ETI27542.1 hypothetical protein G647_09733 [Cladophialophora carrionii CBS 160.54]
MSNISQSSLYSSTNSSTSTLRPRTGRLISYIDDENTESTAVTTSTSSTPPRFPSRGVSPNESALNRSKSTDKSRVGRTNKPQTRSSSSSQAPAADKQSIWEPWGSLQGFASTFLGNTTSSPPKDKNVGTFKTPLWMKQDKNYTSKMSTPQWGPSMNTSASAARDAIEERKAMVQAKKREALLMAGATENRDSLGRFKRRDSDADTAIGGQTDTSDDALVYMHKVEEGDTLAGVIIKYNCPPDLFRKVNRFWPNDNIQTRTRVLVPLEGSTVKGRKVDSPYLSRDLFDSSLEHLSMQDQPKPNGASSPNGVHSPSRPSSSMASSTLTSEPLSIITSMSDATELKHDSWVMLPNFKEAVEVLRVPRRALGYFPRPRQKSNATLTTSSTASTPKTSFDMLRHPPTHAAQQSISLNASPVRRPVFPASRLGSSGRQRSSSTSGNGNVFAEVLRGPGGVGDLRGLRTQMSRPGPADDPLNRKFNQYFPDFLPPPENIPRSGLSRTPTSRATPRASMDSVRSVRSNSSSSGLAGEVSGAIQGWVRTMAGAPGKRDRSAAVDKLGDLIELETNSETVPTDRSRDPSSGRDTGRDKDITPTAATARTSDFATEEALLNERFPIRGRVRNAYASSASGKDKQS